MGSNQFSVFCGAKETMDAIAVKGVKALNPRTMRWNIINKKANYSVVKIGETLYELKSDIDLRYEAKEKGLIL